MISTDNTHIKILSSIICLLVRLHNKEINYIHSIGFALYVPQCFIDLEKIYTGIEHYFYRNELIQPLKSWVNDNII